MYKKGKISLIKTISSIIGVLLCSFFLQTYTSASELPPGLVIGDSQGVYANDDGEYFIDIKNILPGEKYSKEITLRNTDEKEPFELGILASELSQSGSIDFKECLTLTLVLDDKKIYQGKILGEDKDNWTQKALSLGSFSYGIDKILKVIIKVDSTLSNEDFKKGSECKFKWEFVATRNQKPIEPKEENKEKPGFSLPKTGEEWKNALYKICSGLLILLVVLLLWKHKKNQEKKEIEKRNSHD